MTKFRIYHVASDVYTWHFMQGPNVKVGIGDLYEAEEAAEAWLKRYPFLVEK